MQLQYPLISEYLAVIREANDNLGTLCHLEPVLDKYGEPYRSCRAERNCAKSFKR